MNPLFQHRNPLHKIHPACPQQKRSIAVPSPRQADWRIRLLSAPTRVIHVLTAAITNKGDN